MENKLSPTKLLSLLRQLQAVGTIIRPSLSGRTSPFGLIFVTPVNGQKSPLLATVVEVERAHIYRARAEPELFTSSPDEPEPMDFGHRAGFEPSLNQFFQFFGAELTLEPEKKARSSL